MAYTQEAVAQLATETRQVIEKDREETAGGIAAVMESTTIAQFTTLLEWEETRQFQEHQSNQTRNAIDHFAVAQLSVISEKVVRERQKQQEQLAGESSQQLGQAQETERQKQQEQVVAESSRQLAQAPGILRPIP